MYDITIDLVTDLAILNDTVVGGTPKHLSDFNRVDVDKPTGLFFYAEDERIMLMIPWQNVNTIEFKTIL